MIGRKSEHLSKRERQAMEALFRLGRASAQEVMQQMPDPPNYSAVRSLLTVLEEKGLVKHRRESKRYVYEPTESPVRARKGALQRLLATFFDNSPERLVASLLDPGERQLPPEEIARLRSLLDQHASSESSRNP